MVADLGVGADREGTSGLRIAMLGPLTATAGGRVLALGGPLPHRLVAALLVERGEVVADEHLVKRVWCDDWAEAEQLVWEPYRERLRVTVSRLNGVLPAAADGQRIRRQTNGYRIVITEEELDLFTFERCRAQAADALAANQPERSLRFADDALRLWRGRPFGKLAGEHFVVALVEELEKDLLLTQETKVEALIRVHRYSEALPVARALVDAEPDNEHWLALLVRALYGSGRSDRALALCQDYIGRLAHVTGRSPQGELADLEARMLQNDPALVAPPLTPAGSRVGPGGDRADSPKTFLVTSIDHGPTGAGPRPQPGEEALATYESEVRAAVAANLGFVFDESRLGFRAVFENPVHAVLAARDLALAVRSSPIAASQLPVTVAVHTGVADERGTGFTGPPLVHVARLRDACHPGQVLVSEATRGLVTDKLPLGVRLREVAPWQSDAAADPERRYQLVHPDLPGEFPPLRTGSPPAGQPPTYQSEFIGRPDEVADVATRLQEGRLVTIMGQGGVGKTRLAVEVGERVTSRYPDGVRYCDVSLAEGPDALVERLADVLGLTREGGGNQRQEVVRALGTTQPLLVLDGCEHLREAVAELVGEVLAGRGESRVLATSQARLGLPGEQVVPLDPLALPELTDPWPESAPAVELLILRAQRSGARVDPGDPHLLELARRLGGLPLAIELIAVHLTTVPASTVVERLDDYIGEARLPAGPGPDRHRTLRATFDWSFNLASPAARRLLAALSIFRGTWSLAQAESLAGAVDVEPERVIALTAELSNLSILRADLQPGGTGRYRMLDTIRSFAAAHLAELGRVDAVADLHADHFLHLAEEAARHRRGPDEPAWVGEVDAEFDNMRAAYRHFVDHDRLPAALRLVVALGDDLLMRERLEIGRWARDLAAHPDLATDPRRVVALGLAANAVMLRGRLEQAERLAREAVTAEAEIPGAPPAWMAHNVLGMVQAVQLGDGWVEHIHTMEAMSDAIGDPFPRALALWNRVFVAEYTGSREYAEAAAPDLLALGDKHDNPSIRSMGLWARGRAAAMQGDTVRARDLFQQALGVAEAARNTLMVNKTLRALADLVADLGHPRAALTALCRIARSFRSSGNVAEQAQTARSICEYLVAIGELVPAARALGRLQHSPLKESPDFGAFVDGLMDRLTPEERDRVQREGAATPLDEVITDLIRVVDALPPEEATP